MKVRIARRGIEDKQKLGRDRWVVGCTVSWPLRLKRLGPRSERIGILRPPPLLLLPAFASHLEL